MSFLLSTWRQCDQVRYNRAVRALRDGSLTVTITHHTEAEIRALVKNGEGTPYGITLTEHGATCSCPDFLWRGVAACKHIAAVCIHCLQQHEPAETPIHLWLRSDALPLCGEPRPVRCTRGWFESVAAWPDACPACVRAWTHPAKLLPVTRAEHFALPGGRRGRSCVI